MFVAMGGIGVLGAVIWFALYRDPDPARLTGADRAYVEANGGCRPTPVSLQSWRHLFGYRSMWGMILGAFCSGYAIWMYGTWLPGYLEMQHHVSIAKTGVLAMIPLACSIAGSIVGGWVTDRLANSGMDVVRSRKLPAVVWLLAVGGVLRGGCGVGRDGDRARLHLRLDVLPVLRPIRQVDADHRHRAAIRIRRRSRRSRISAPISAAPSRRS